MRPRRFLPQPAVITFMASKGAVFGAADRAHVTGHSIAAPLLREVRHS